MSRYFVLLISGFCLLLQACAGFDPSEIKNLNDGKIIKAAHGGMGFTNLVNPFNPLPANSMGSIKKALSFGAEGLEVDLQITQDSVLVLYHDNNLKTKTGLDGCMQTLSSKVVVGRPYVCGFPYDHYQEEKIVSFEELLIFLKEEKQFPLLYLDLHALNHCSLKEGGKMFDAYVNEMIGLLKKHEIPMDKVVPISSVPKLLLKIRRAEPAIFLVFEETADFDNALETVQKNSFPGLAIKSKLLDAEKSAKAHELGVQVITFGGKTRSGLIDLIKKNPDVIQADNIEILNELLP